MSARIAAKANSRKRSRVLADYGITASTQAGLNRAASLIQQAIAVLEDVHQAAELDSDMEVRANEAISELETALSTVQWVPAADH